MYKVFFNRVELVLCDFNEFRTNFSSKNDTIRLEEQPNLTKFNSLLNSEVDQTLVWVSESVISDWKNFVSQFKIVEAAGGLVFNEQSELLVIFRNGKWDLPKGKLEKKESKRQAAIREVEEETLAKIDSCKNEIFKTTHHVYFHKQKWVLKPTYWYEMSVKGAQELTPQVEEGIEKVCWMSEGELESKFSLNTFRSILYLLEN